MLKRTKLNSLKRETEMNEKEDGLHVLEELKKQYTYPTNTDFKIKVVKAESIFFICYLASAIDGKRLEEEIIKSLLNHWNGDIESTISNLQLKKAKEIGEIVSSINHGLALIIGEETNWLVNVSKIETRGIEKSTNEIVIKGPKEAFTESIEKNISLIRKLVPSEKMINEEVFVNSKKTETVNLIYLKDIANEEIIEKVKEALRKIELDYIKNIETLEQLIEMRPYSLFSSILYTEKPDRAATSIEEGHIVLMMRASSACLIVPVTFWTFFHSSEDHYMRFFNGNFARVIRLIGMWITMFTSAFYVAITNYHQEMIPSDLLLAIASAREKVPFPIIIEVLIMELSFELIREAGLRIPTPLGPTIGIVGALILGQAAVQANIISPIIVIVVALSGLSSFTISDISLNYSIRLLRFMFIVCAGIIGIYGIAVAFICLIMYMGSLKSFGVSFLSPYTPHYLSSGDTIFRKIIQNEKFRPGEIIPKKIRKKG